MAEHKTGGDRTRSRGHWQAHIKAQEKSGLSRAEYCRRHDLSYHALTYWQRKLYRPRRQHAQLVPVSVETIPHVRSASASGIKILLNNRIAIEVADQFSPRTLSQILSVLENR